jgi:hypothetical protein
LFLNLCSYANADIYFLYDKRCSNASLAIESESMNRICDMLLYSIDKKYNKVDENENKINFWLTMIFLILNILFILNSKIYSNSSNHKSFPLIYKTLIIKQKTGRNLGQYRGYMHLTFQQQKKMLPTTTILFY